MSKVRVEIDSLGVETTIDDADYAVIKDTSASLLKKITWANFKATLATWLGFTKASSAGPTTFAFYEDTDNGSNKVSLKAPASVASDVDVILPGSAGTLALTSYVDAAVVGLLEDKGNQDCSANPNYPAASKGDVYTVSVAGKIGGASGTTVEVGDWFRAIADNAGGTHAGVGTSWVIVQANLVGAYVSGGTDVPITDGGTGASTAAAGLANLGGASDTRTVVPKTANYAIVAATDHDKIFTNGGTAGDVTFTLPASAGCTAGKTRFTILNLDTSSAFRNKVLVAGSDHLYFSRSGTPYDITGGATTDDTRSAGDTITVRYAGGGVWYVETLVGDWA